MAGPAVRVEGLSELRRALRKLEDGTTWSRELGSIQRDVAKKVAGWASSNAGGMGGPFAHFSGAIRGRGGVAGAKVAVANPDANATFWGAMARTGWNAGNNTPNHPKWVGNGWDVGGPGGPYAINPAIADHKDEIVDGDYGDAIDDLMQRALR